MSEQTSTMEQQIAVLRANQTVLSEQIYQLNGKICDAQRKLNMQVTNDALIKYVDRLRQMGGITLERPIGGAPHLHRGYGIQFYLYPCTPFVTTDIKTMLIEPKQPTDAIEHKLHTYLTTSFSFPKTVRQKWDGYDMMPVMDDDPNNAFRVNPSTGNASITMYYLDR
jgi:hypothetical protein